MARIEAHRSNEGDDPTLLWVSTFCSNRAGGRQRRTGHAAPFRLVVVMNCLMRKNTQN